MPSRYCYNCGAEIKPEWNSCASCGAKLKDEQDDYDLPSPQAPQPQYQQQPYQQPYQQQPQYQQQTQYYAKTSRENNNGVIALVTGLIACCCWIIFAPIAIIYGIKGRNEDAEPTLGTIGLILGIVNVILGIINMVLVFTSLFYYY